MFEEAFSYVNKVLYLPFPVEDGVIMSHTNEMLARKFYPVPHMQTGISVPEWVWLDLGVNSTYQFSSRFDLTLLKVAFNGFNCSRWWECFWFNRGESNDNPWNQLRLVHRAVNDACEMIPFL